MTFTGAKSNGPLWITVSGSSMTPTLCPGDEVLLEPMADRVGPRVGDVVVARLPTGWALHRVVDLSDEAVVTRGDACVARDPPISKLDAMFVAVLRRRDQKTEAIPPAEPPALLRFRRGHGPRRLFDSRRLVQRHRPTQSA